MGKWIMVFWGIVGIIGMMIEPKNTLRELAAMLIMVLGFGFAFVIYAIEESKTNGGKGNDA